MADGMLGLVEEIIPFLNADVRREYNPFEPDNQSARYQEALELLGRVQRMHSRMQLCPACKGSGDIYGVECPGCGGYGYHI